MEGSFGAEATPPGSVRAPCPRTGSSASSRRILSPVALLDSDIATATLPWTILADFSTISLAAFNNRAAIHLPRGVGNPAGRGCISQQGDSHVSHRRHRNRLA